MKACKKVLSILVLVVFCITMLIPSQVFAYSRQNDIVACFQNLADLQQEYMSSCKTDRYGRAYWNNPNRSQQSIANEAKEVRNNIESLVEFVEDWYGIRNDYYASNGSNTYQQTMSIVQKLKNGQTNYELSRWTTEGVFDAALVGVSYVAVRAIGSLVGGSRVAQLGDEIGNLGTLVKNPNVKINWTAARQHALNRMEQKGVSKGMFESWVNTGKTIRQDENTYLFLTRDGVAVVSREGIPQTAYTSDYFKSQIIDAIKQVFGN